VAIDESLLEFTGQDRFIAGAGNVITLRTTANFYGLPGLELAYAVSNESTIRELRMRRDCSLNILAVEAARTALKDETYRKLARRFIAAEKELLSKGLEKVSGITYFDSDSNVYLVKLERPEDRILDSFLRSGFFIRDCSDIAGLGRSFLRLSVMSHDRNLKLLRLMKMLVPPVASSSG
jgi:histidinol-phosphate/aromatic aminotransferase/cobyric acid decarboxylase-like protein